MIESKLRALGFPEQDVPAKCDYRDGAKAGLCRPVFTLFLFSDLLCPAKSRETEAVTHVDVLESEHLMPSPA